MNKNEHYIETNGDHWVCVCKNNTMDVGFSPCKANGDYQEPNASWSGLYACQQCGRIIDPESSKVIGQNKNAIKYNS